MSNGCIDRVDPVWVCRSQNMGDCNRDCHPDLLAFEGGIQGGCCPHCRVRDTHRNKAVPHSVLQCHPHCRVRDTLALPVTTPPYGGVPRRRLRYKVRVKLGYTGVSVRHMSHRNAEGAPSRRLGGGIHPGGPGDTSHGVHPFSSRGVSLKTADHAQPT
jgi:hypothetical protein